MKHKIHNEPSSLDPATWKEGIVGDVEKRNDRARPYIAVRYDGYACSFSFDRLVCGLCERKLKRVCIGIELHIYRD